MKGLLKYIILSISILAIGTWLYAQTAVIGIPWELRGVNVYLGTSAATGKVLFPNTSSGIELYNTADITLNYERAFLRWNANVFNIGTEKNAGGTERDLAIPGSLGTIVFTKGYLIDIQRAGGAYLKNTLGNLIFVTAAEFFFQDQGNTINRIIFSTNAALGSTFVSFNSKSPAGDNPNYNTQQNQVATTDVTTTTLHSIPLVDTNVYLVEARVVARCTGGAGGNVGNGVSYILKQAFKRSGGGAAAIGVLTTESWEDAAIAGWTAILDTNVNDVRVRVTGAATDNATWHVTVFVQNLSS